MSIERKIKRFQEQKEQERIKELYSKKPKNKCPRCHQKSLFFTNDKKEVFCIRCNEKVRIDKN